MVSFWTSPGHFLADPPFCPSAKAQGSGVVAISPRSRAMVLNGPGVTPALWAIGVVPTPRFTCSALRLPRTARDVQNRTGYLCQRKATLYPMSYAPSPCLALAPLISASTLSAAVQFSMDGPRDLGSRLLCISVPATMLGHHLLRNSAAIQFSLGFRLNHKAAHAFAGGSFDAFGILRLL